MKPLKAAVAINPKDPNAFMCLGICLKVFKKDKESDAAFQRACTLGLADACSDPE
jgi:Flp pilus assembly protein TadD